MRNRVKSEGSRPTVSNRVKSKGSRPGHEQGLMTREKLTVRNRVKSKGSRPTVSSRVESKGSRPIISSKLFASRAIGTNCQ